MKIYDLVVIGAGPAGLTAGIYAGRAKQSVLIIEKENEIGGQIKTTNEVVNYPGVQITTGKALAETMKVQAKNFGVSFAGGEVKSVNLEGNIKSLNTSFGEIRAYSIIIATGGTPRAIGFKGEKEFKGRGVGYCATCDGEFFTDLEVFVIGGGYAAAEEAVFLTRFAKKVTIIVRESDFTCAESVAEKAKKHPKIEVKYNTEVIELIGNDILEKATFVNNKTQERWSFIPDKKDETFGVFVFAGYKPETEFLQGKIEKNSQGYILTDKNMATNVKGIYAAGDVREKDLRQVVTAVSDGALAAIEAEKYVNSLKERLGIVIEKESKERENKKEEFLTYEIKNSLKDLFKHMTKDVYLATIVDEELESSKELVEIIHEFSQLGDKIKIIKKPKGEDIEFEKRISADKFPIVSLLDENKNYTGIKFHGIPGGHEVNSFVVAIYNLGISNPNIDERLKVFASKFNRDINLKVLVSLSCHLCPEIVMNLQKLALLNRGIETEIIDISLFPDLKKEYKIMSVPAILKGNDTIIFGAKSIEELIKFIEN